MTRGRQSDQVIDLRVPYRYAMEMRTHPQHVEHGEEADAYPY